MNHIQSLNKLVTYVDDYDFPIETIPMKGMLEYDTVNCPDRIMIIRTDTNEYLGNHSTAYRPVTHSQIINPVKDILTNISKEYVPQIKTY